MRETQREPTPRADDGELDTAVAFLDFADYREAVAESMVHLDAAGSPDARTAVLVDGERKSLRWVLAHKTAEMFRHVGHADILREQIDGVTGR